MDQPVESWRNDGIAAPDLVVERRADGAILLTPREPLGAYDRQIGDWLRRWAERSPTALFLAERNRSGHHREVTYAEARATVDRLSQALMDRDLSADRPLAVLSEKGIAHGLLALAAMQVGIPYVPISPTFSLRPEARERLQQAIEAVTPGLVFIDDGPRFDAILPLLATDTAVVFEHHPPTTRRATAFDDLAAATPTGDVERAFAAVEPDTVAKILFTSGSTGRPKPAINTHRNMISNQQALRQVWRFLADEPPVVVDWQPWHHCGGGNFNFYTAFSNGGSYVCDRGRPTADGAAETLAHLARTAPTIHFNVPFGYELLAQAMTDDPALRDRFFSRLRMLVYSGAAIPLSLRARLAELAEAAGKPEVPLISAYGMTEMGPLHTIEHRPSDGPPRLGTPVPGCTVKLVPTQERYELRGKGPNITPGYFRAPDLTAAALDDEGYFKTADAVTFVDDTDPNAGLAFDGRLVEEFKLSTGTWVPVGDVRTALLSAARPLVSDAIIVGENRDEVGALLVLTLEMCRSLCSDPSMSLPDAAADDRIRDAISKSIADYNERFPTSSRRIGRIALLDHLPKLETGETTDKGYINQRLARDRRRDLIDALYDITGTEQRAVLLPANGEDRDQGRGDA